MVDFTDPFQNPVPGASTNNLDFGSTTEFNPEDWRTPGASFPTGTPAAGDMRTYVNREGHKISVTFVDGRPSIPIPPGYVPEAEATASFADPTQKPDEDPAHVPMAGREDENVRDMSEWSVDELEGVLKQQDILDQFAKASVLLGGPAGTIAGLGVRAMGRASQSKALEEIEDRLEEDPNSPDRDRLISLRDQIAGDGRADTERRGPLGERLFGGIADAFTNLFGGGKDKEERMSERQARREEREASGGGGNLPGGFTSIKDMFDGGGAGRSGREAREEEKNK